MISILIGTGFEEVEAITVYDILKRGKLDVELVSVTGALVVSSARNLEIQCDSLLDDNDLTKQQLIVVPGGMGGVKRIISSPSAKDFLTKAMDRAIYIAAICAGPLVLDKFKLLDGYKFTCYPSVQQEMENTDTEKYYISDKNVVVDKNLITSISPGTAPEFAFKLLEILAREEVLKQIYDNWWGNEN